MRFHGMTLGQYGETVELPDARFVIEEGAGPLDLSSVPQTTARASSNFITRGAPGPGLQEITADGDLVTFEWDNGRTRDITVPTVRGVGVPDGGSPGQVVTRTAGGTAWADALPDTGPRSIHTLVQGWEGIGLGGNRIQRVGPFVSLNIQLRNPTVPGSGWFSTWTLPSGFRPMANFSDYLTATTEATPLATLYLDSAGTFRAYRSRETAAWGFANITFLTSDPWPTSLPGTPA